MRSPHQDSVEFHQTADAVFEAALAVAQNNKTFRILAVHTSGRRLILREHSKFSNSKFHRLSVDGHGEGSQLHLVVGTDPRNPKAMLDGRANAKSLKTYVSAVQGVLDGSAPATATPVADHYLQKKTEVPWTDASQDPDIELDGNILAVYGL